MSQGRRRILDGAAALLPAMALLLASLLAALAIGLAPRPGQARLAVVAAPWTGLGALAEIVAAADGAIVGAGWLPNVIIAHSDNPAFAAALRRAGAWLVLDPGLAGGCGSAGRSPDRAAGRT